MTGAAAVLLVALAAGATGWTLGRAGDGGSAEQASAAQLLSERGYAQFVAESPGRTGPAVMAVGNARPIDWLADEVSIGLKAPDLSEAGYELVDKRAVAVNGERFVQLDYAGEEGKSFSLFLAPRWEGDGHEIVEARRGDVSMASWLDGPLVSAVVARMPPDRTRSLAEAVREAMRAGGEPPAVLQPDPAAPAIGAGIIADGVVTPISGGLPGAATPADADVRPN